MKSPVSPSNCEICLWSFGTKSELDIHNYLEHLIINGVQAEYSRTGCSSYYVWLKPKHVTGQLKSFRNLIDLEI